MSTRCNVRFMDDSKTPEANIYIHSDGYPDGEHGIVNKFRMFLQCLVDNVRDKRFNDPSYLAAKFVVFMAHEFAGDNHFLEFLSVGVVNENAGDGEYVYNVYPPNTKNAGNTEMPGLAWFDYDGKLLSSVMFKLDDKIGVVSIL